MIIVNCQLSIVNCQFDKGGGELVLKGNLAEIGIAEIVKALSLIGKSGKLALVSDENTGIIYLRQGNVISAEARDLRGEEALYSMALWTTGSFTYDPAMTLVDRNIHIGSESLFIGLSSQVDRYNYLLSRCPPLDVRLSVEETLDAARYNAEQRKFLAIISKRAILDDVLSRSPYDKLKSLEIIAKLIGIEWVHGLHILAPEQEELVPRLVRESGLKDFAPDVDTGQGNGHNKPSSGHSGKRNPSQFVSSQAFDVDSS